MSGPLPRNVIEDIIRRGRKIFNPYDFPEYYTRIYRSTEIVGVHGYRFKGLREIFWVSTVPQLEILAYTLLRYQVREVSLRARFQYYGMYLSQESDALVTYTGLDSFLSDLEVRYPSETTAASTRVDGMVGINNLLAVMSRRYGGPTIIV
jgi:hypothetical protein